MSAVASAGDRRGDVDEPHERLDPDGGPHGQDELAALLAGEVTVETLERLGDPADRPSLAQGQGADLGGLRLERQPQHRPLLRLCLGDHRGEADDRIEALGDVARGVGRQHRRRGRSRGGQRRAGHACSGSSGMRSCARCRRAAAASSTVGVAPAATSSRAAATRADRVRAFWAERPVAS